MVLPFLLARLGRREWRALAANTQGRQEDFKDILVLVVPLLGNFSSCLRWSRCCFFWGKSLKLFSIGMVVVLTELTTRKFVKPEIVSICMIGHVFSLVLYADIYSLTAGIS